MKKILLSGLILYALTGLCQDTSKIRQIDSIVEIITRTELTRNTDSIIHNMPDLSIQMKTFVTSYFKENDLKKYVQRTNAIVEEKGKTHVTNTSSTFYFDNKKLIKVEESGNKNGNDMNAEWYYYDDKPLYYTHQSDQSEARSFLLLSMAKSIQGVFLQNMK